MKYILTVIPLFSATIMYSQLQVNVKWAGRMANNSRDTIYYQPGTEVAWNDFKGRPDLESGAAAMTYSGFGFNAAIQSRSGRGTLTINLYCYFDRSKSWVKASSKNDYALLHEQHHFDVSYIASNIFMQKLQQAKFTLSNYNRLLTEIYNESTAALEKMQDDYDGQTSNGRVPEVQAAWNKKIDTRLAQLATD